MAHNLPEPYAIATVGEASNSATAAGGVDAVRYLHADDLQHVPDVDHRLVHIAGSGQASPPDTGDAVSPPQAAGGHDMYMHGAAAVAGGCPEDEIRDQDRFLPIANVARVMKRHIPGNGKIAKEAKECMQECVSEYISFLTSEACDRCQTERRKTITGEDIIFAMQVLGFDNYVEPLKQFLMGYRENIRGTSGRFDLPPYEPVAADDVNGLEAGLEAGTPPSGVASAAAASSAPPSEADTYMEIQGYQYGPSEAGEDEYVDVTGIGVGGGHPGNSVDTAHTLHVTIEQPQVVAYGEHTTDDTDFTMMPSSELTALGHHP